MQTKGTLFWPLIVAVVVSDVITKKLAVDNLAPHVPHEVVGNFLRFSLSYNTGAAFGLSWFGASRWVYVVLTAIILLILLSMYRDAPRSDKWQAAALGLIVGGAIGNLIDRLRWERGVVDFIDVGIGTSRFWTFNIADSGITVGASMMVVIFLLHARRKQPVESETPDG